MSTLNPQTDPHIRVVISKVNRTIEAVVQNVTGPKCSDMTAPIRQIGRVLRDEHTPDFYQGIQEDVNQTNYE